MTNDKLRLFVGAIISLVLLGFYAYTLLQAIGYAASLPPRPGPAGPPPTDNAYWVLQMIGALVSALVAAELALTARGGPPAGRILALADSSDPPLDGERGQDHLGLLRPRLARPRRGRRRRRPD